MKETHLIKTVLLWEFHRAATPVFQQSHSVHGNIEHVIMMLFSLSKPRLKLIPDSARIMEPQSKHTIWKTFQSYKMNYLTASCSQISALLQRFCCPCWVFPCYCSQSREGERERVREVKKERQEKGFGLSLAPPHIHIRTHTSFCPFINSFLCFVLCAIRTAGVCGLSFASMHTEGFLWFRSVTNSQTSHSTGMYHSRIFPSVRPEDFIILMRDAWYSLSGNVIC